MKQARTIKDPLREKRIFAFRAFLSVVVVILLAAVLLSRFYYLQIDQHEVYQTISDKNRMQLQSVPPTRGLIFDRNGELLADNQPVFSVALVKERVVDMDSTINRISELVPLSDDDVGSFRKRLQSGRRPYDSTILKSKLTEEEIARLAIHRHELPGVEVEAELVRFYPHGEIMAHMLGYVGRINERELKKLDPVKYAGTNYIGKLGVEKFYEDTLRGEVGYQTVETNARGRVLRVLERQDPHPGRNLQLNIDAPLQGKLVETLGDQRGAVVAIDPRDGGILALVSTPSFDANLFVTGIDHTTYSALRDSPDIPLFNRALRGQYPPGSTIKPIVGLAGLESGVVTPQTSVWDPGWYQLKNDERFYRDWKREGHGRVNLHESIVQSCDTYFYDLAFKMGVDRMSPYLEHFGFGFSTALDINEDKVGILPSRDWKRGARGLPWFPGDSLNMGIGQGYMLATPLQLATATAILANRGRWVQPKLLRGAGEGLDLMPARDISDRMSDVVSKPENWNVVLEAMRDVMHGRRGTARSSASGASYLMAGKTGTAQVVGIKQGEKYDAEALAERLRDHALFIGFAPYENPTIAVAVIVENGGGGSRTAAPVARAAFDYWIHERKNGVKAVNVVAKRLERDHVRL